MRVVTAARPAIKVKDSRLWSQNCDGPPKPCSLIIERAKSKPNRSAFSTIVRLRSKLGMYCGEGVDISQPLLPMGMKTPSCMQSNSGRTERAGTGRQRRCRGNSVCSGRDELVPFAREVAILVHHGVPHGDVAQPLVDAAAVPPCAGFLHELAEGAENVCRSRLAVIPVVPLRRRQELPRVLRLRRVVALARDEGALKAAGVPVEIFVEAVALQSVEML